MVLFFVSALALQAAAQETAGRAAPRAPTRRSRGPAVRPCESAPDPAGRARPGRTPRPGLASASASSSAPRTSGSLSSSLALALPISASLRFSPAPNFQPSWHLGSERDQTVLYAGGGVRWACAFLTEKAVGGRGWRRRWTEPAWSAARVLGEGAGAFGEPPSLPPRHQTPNAGWECRARSVSPVSPSLQD